MSTDISTRTDFNLFADSEIISAYTREEAVEDGVLVDAQAGDYREVTASYHRDFPVYMTSAVAALVDEAVSAGSSRQAAWREVCAWSSRALLSIDAGETKRSPALIKFGDEIGLLHYVLQVGFDGYALTYMVGGED